MPTVAVCDRRHAPPCIPRCAPGPRSAHLGAPARLEPPLVSNQGPHPGMPTTKKPEGRLAILLPGLGAVATTLVAGVDLIRRGKARPVGSLTQMGTARLGRRSERSEERRV